MRETQCPTCDAEATVICYLKDDPVVFCNKCGSFIMTIDMQEHRDRYVAWTTHVIHNMSQETAKLQKTVIGRLRLRFKLLFGWNFPGIETVLRMNKRTIGLADYVRRRD